MDLGDRTALLRFDLERNDVLEGELSHGDSNRLQLPLGRRAVALSVLQTAAGWTATDRTGRHAAGQPARYLPGARPRRRGVHQRSPPKVSEILFFSGVHKVQQLLHDRDLPPPGPLSGVDLGKIDCHCDLLRSYLAAAALRSYADPESDVIGARRFSPQALSRSSNAPTSRLLRFNPKPKSVSQLLVLRRLKQRAARSSPWPDSTIFSAHSSACSNFPWIR